MVRIRELLSRSLPLAPATVLDVGGGPGAHARWLTAEGYHVHLVDPVQRHLDQAAKAGCTVEFGDARALTAPGSQRSGHSDRRATRAAPRCCRSRGRVGDRPVRVVMRRSR
ncbi:class I SAM-dependent methyltransferase [Streptomyces sp. NPDC085927]|uniref:class I SAM-dependent methyltransferase n=1 Tax=Streptomyces sp. NPDC085927 TaxID=3365738 RepID=UPI0037CDA58E